MSVLLVGPKKWQVFQMAVPRQPLRSGSNLGGGEYTKVNMTFQQLLVKFTDKDILKKLFELYPNQKKSKDGYIKALVELRSKRKSKTDCKIEIKHVKQTLGGETDEWEDVSGRVEGEDQNYAIELLPWSQWLSMEITPETTQRYSSLEILAYCLWEMTFFGYSNDQIQNKMRSLDKTTKQALKDIEEHPERFKQINE